MVRNWPRDAVIMLWLGVVLFIIGICLILFFSEDGLGSMDLVGAIASLAGLMLGLMGYLRSATHGDISRLEDILAQMRAQLERNTTHLARNSELLAQILEALKSLGAR